VWKLSRYKEILLQICSTNVRKWNCFWILNIKFSYINISFNIKFKGRRPTLIIAINFQLKWWNRTAFVPKKFKGTSSTWLQWPRSQPHTWTPSSSTLNMKDGPSDYPSSSTALHISIHQDLHISRDKSYPPN
jgi:hypothetical protein